MDDVVWLTYDEIAARLGIERESARTLTKRRHWDRQPGNDGKARIAVPVAALSRGDPGDDPQVEPGDEQGDDPQTESVVPEVIWREIIAGLDARVADLRDALDRERGERLAERDRTYAMADRAAEMARELARVVEAGSLRERELAREAAERVMRERELHARAVAAETMLMEYRTRPWWRRLAG